MTEKALRKTRKTSKRQSLDFPVRRWSGWKAVPTGRQECLPHASSLAASTANFGIQVKLFRARKAQPSLSLKLI